MPSQSWRLEGANREWKAAWCSVQVLLFELFLLLCTLFLLADQDSSCCNYVLRTTDLYAMILFVTTSSGNIKEAAIMCHCRLKRQNSSVFVLLFYIISLLLQLFFQLFALFQNKKSLFGLEFIADNRPIALSNSEHHWGTLFVASRSGVDSILDHQDAFSHNRASICSVVLWVRTTDVWKPSGTHGRTKLIAQVINGLGNQGPLVLPHVVCKYKILTNLQKCK